MKVKQYVFLLIFFMIIISCKSDNEYFSSDSIDVSKIETSGSAFHPAYDDSFILNEDGIPTSNGEPNPTIVSSYLLRLFRKYQIEKSTDDIKKMIIAADWLVKNITDHSDYISWDFQTEVTDFSIMPPWNSSLSNALAAGGLFLTASIIEDDEGKRNIYNQTAYKGLMYLFTDISEGGGLGCFPDGSIWFEEYPGSVEQPFVLNGHMFALEIIDMLASTSDCLYLTKMRNKGFSSLIMNIDKYDRNYGSLYDLYLEVDKLGSSYHHLHWEQVAWAYIRTGNEHLYNISKRWYEAEMQSYKTIISASNEIDPVNHGERNLNDAKYWYGYWSAENEAFLTCINETVFPVYCINLFCYSFKEPTVIKIYNDENEEILYSCSYVNSNEETRNRGVITLSPIESSYFPDTVTISISKPYAGDIIALREIGLQREMTEKFLSEIDDRISSLDWDE